MDKRILIFIFLLTAINYSYAQNPLIKRYTIADGLPTNTVYHVYQDNDQFLWFSTDAGAIRFNGHHFEVFDMEKGLSDNEVIKIKQDKSGRIWFFNLNLSLNYYYKGKIYNSSNSEMLKNIQANFLIHDFYEDKDSTLYFYNLFYDVFKITIDEKVENFRLGVDLKTHRNLLRIGKSHSGNFLLWTKRSLIGLSDLQGTPKIISSYAHIRRISPSFPYKNIFLTIDKELNIYSDTMLIEKFKLDIGTFIVNSIIIDKTGVMWISTLDKGVFCIKEKQVIYHLDIEQAQAIIQDKDNNIWVTSMKNGIYKINSFLNQHQLTHYDNNQFNNKPIFRLEKNNQGGVWGINTNSVYLIKDEKVYKTSKHNDYKSLKYIKQLKNNDLITTEFDEHIYLSKNYSINKSTNSYTINKKQIYDENYGKNFVPTISEKGLITFNTNKIKPFDFEKGFIESAEQKVGSRIYSIFYNQNKELVINSRKNYLFKNDSIIDNSVLQKINGKIITSQIVLSDSSEVLNINGKNLILLYRDKLFDLIYKSEINYQYKFRKLAYSNSQLFISTIKKIYFLSNPESIIKGEEIILKDLDIEFNNITDIKCNNDTLFVASDDGITIIPIDNYLDHSIIISKPYIKTVTINQLNVDFTSGIISYMGDSKLNINFSDINYSSYPTIYSYKMKGIDDKWQESLERNAIYQNLPAGRYTFCIKARINTKTYGQTRELTIEIKPTLFEHLSFWIVISIIAILLIIAIVYYLKNRLNRKKEIEYQLLSLEHKALQSMMNPHFIFNSLGSIQSYLLQNKSSEAGLYLSQFARLIRQNMNSLNSNFISIEDETDRLKNYMDLEKFRMNNKFSYFIDIDENIEADDVLIPSMIIQVFVENAIWHGISPLDSEGEINIRFTQRNEKNLYIFIEDNGIGILKAKSFGKNESHLGVGMEITKKRLQILGKKYNIKSQFYSSELYPGRLNPGTRITLIVPTTIEKNLQSASDNTIRF